ILRSDTHRVLALLRHRGVVDHQHRIAAADQMVRLNQQFRLQWRRIPDTSSNKMMQLIIVARRKSLCHRLNALAFTRANQPCHVEGTHPPPRLVIQAIQKRLQPTSKLALPIRRCPPHGRPSKSRPPMNHRKTELGIPDRLSPVRICQSSARSILNASDENPTIIRTVSTTKACTSSKTP